jgi:rhodanese-related sulfurtransferase
VAGDLRLPFSRAGELLDGLDPSRTYLLVCASGQRSYTLARELVRRGVTAWSLDGGVGALPPHAA